MDASTKKMKQAFAELQSRLMDREVALLAEMDKVKAEAMEILLSHQKKAELLKKMTDVAVRMSEEQLVELRADIKVKLPSLFCLSSCPRGLQEQTSIIHGQV